MLRIGFVKYRFSVKMRIFLAVALVAQQLLLLTDASVVWSGSNGLLLKNGVPVALKGFSVTCMEYLLKGVGL